MASPFDPQPQDEITRLFLYPIKVAARGKISAQMLHDLEVRVSREDSLSYFHDSLLVELRTHVYADQVSTDEVIVPFSKTIKAPAHDARVHTAAAHLWRRVAVMLWAFLFAAFAVASTNTAPAWATFAMLASSLCAVILLGVWACEDRYEHVRVPGRDVTVSGDVFVDVKQYNTFPDNNTVYPDNLGRPVPIVMHNPKVTFYRGLPDERP